MQQYFTLTLYHSMASLPPAVFNHCHSTADVTQGEQTMENQSPKLPVKQVKLVQRGSNKMAKLAIIILGLIALLYLAAIIVPNYMRNREVAASSLAKTGISAIHKVYNVYEYENGTLEGLTPEAAIAEADLGVETISKWDFNVVLKSEEELLRSMEYKRTHLEETLYVPSPIKYIIATSKKANPKGEYRRVWFNPDVARYHGYGSDKMTNPDEGFEYLK